MVVLSFELNHGADQSQVFTQVFPLVLSLVLSDLYEVGVDVLVRDCLVLLWALAVPGFSEFPLSSSCISLVQASSVPTRALFSCHESLMGV